MKHWCGLVIGWALFFQSCGYLAGPEGVGEVQINLRFTHEDPAAVSFLKTKQPVSLQAVDRVVVIVRENIESLNVNRVLARDVVRKEFRLGNDRTLKTTIEVPLQNAGVNYFDLQIQAFQGLALLYSGQDFIFFDEKIKQVTAAIQLEPVAFRLFIPTTIPPTSNRLFTLSGQVQDSSITELEIIADSVNVRFPVQRGAAFANPVMLLGNTTTVRTLAYRGQEFYGEASRQVIFTGRKADVLVALVWDQPIDLNLEILNPLQQIISATAPGDSVGGSGRLQINDNDGYGPEVFEWRSSTRILTGPFLIRVARPRANPQPASGKVYVYFREGQLTQSRRIFSFEFKPQDSQFLQNIFNFTWPVQ